MKPRAMSSWIGTDRIGVGRSYALSAPSVRAPTYKMNNDYAKKLDMRLLMDRDLNLQPRGMNEAQSSIYRGTASAGLNPGRKMRFWSLTTCTKCSICHINISQIFVILLSYSTPDSMSYSENTTRENVFTGVSRALQRKRVMISLPSIDGFFMPREVTKNKHLTDLTEARKVHPCYAEAAWLPARGMNMRTGQSNSDDSISRKYAESDRFL